MTPKTVISASRRSDIPAFYMDWFMKSIENRFFEVVNPYNRMVSRIAVTPESVHTIVFWSKNFGPFLSGGYGERLMEMGFHLYFSYTLNSENPILEPHLPPLKKRLSHLNDLAHRFDPAWIDWRFDPICFYRDEKGYLQDNLGDFSHIADTASNIGIRRCITSFVDLYQKVENRVRYRPEVSFMDPEMNVKSKIVRDLSDLSAQKDIQLHLCCEKELLATLPADIGVKQSACIPNHRLKKLFGGDVSIAQDKGQRVKSGCGCRVSVDIGSYALHPCLHNCLFCYANPSAPPQSIETG